VTEVRNLDKRRVGDISQDKRVYVIHLKGCLTKISANADGTLSISQGRVKKAN
jgi:hypothetical protein